MASQEWDDHDRSKKTLAYDLGKDYLESCEKNAIVISFGDNDTYPLWFTQEVPGNRKDLRVMNYSLLATDWYMNQLRYKVNESEPADVVFTEEQVEGSKRDAVFSAAYLGRYNIPNNPSSLFDQNKYYDLKTILKTVTASDDPRYRVAVGEDEFLNTFPVSKVSVPVDKEYVKQHMALNPGDSVVSELKLEIKKSFVQKNDLAILALIATTDWKRPIYFTSTQELEELGLDKYVRMEGLTYRLVPIENGAAPQNIAYQNIMEKFAYGNADKKGLYYDEENRRHLNSIKHAHAMIALNLIQLNKKDSAKNILNRYDKMVSQENMPYGFTSNRGNLHNRFSITFLLAAYQSGDFKLAEKVSQSVRKDLEQQMKYYRSLGDPGMDNNALGAEAYAYMNQKPTQLNRDQEVFVQDIMSCFDMLRQMDDLDKQFKPQPTAAGVESSGSSLKQDTKK
jgi:hypothetical protein